MDSAEYAKNDNRQSNFNLATKSSRISVILVITALTNPGGLPLGSYMKDIRNITWHVTALALSHFVVLYKQNCYIYQGMPLIYWWKENLQGLSSLRSKSNISKNGL